MSETWTPVEAYDKGNRSPGWTKALRDYAVKLEADLKEAHEKLRRVRDDLCFEANSDGGLVAEIDKLLDGSGEVGENLGPKAEREKVLDEFSRSRFSTERRSRDD